ncbi:hypothetical protein D1872_261490 [compost metagenome]
MMHVHVFIRVDDRGAVRPVIRDAIGCLLSPAMKLVRHAGDKGMPQSIRVRQNDGAFRVLPVDSAQPFVNALLHIADFIDLHTLCVGVVYADR